MSTTTDIDCVAYESAPQPLASTEDLGLCWTQRSTLRSTMHASWLSAEVERELGAVFPHAPDVTSMPSWPVYEGIVRSGWGTRWG